MTRVGGGDLAAKLQQWSKSQGLGNDVGKLNVNQMQEAARELKVPLNDLVKAREGTVAKSAAQTETAGKAFQKTREGAKGASLNYGGVQRADRSPIMGRFAFEPKLGNGKDKSGHIGGKGGVMRFEPKLQAKNDAGLRRREDRAMTSLYYKSGYSYSDAEKVQSSFNFASVGEAKAYIGLKIAQGTESILRERGVTPNPFDDHECRDAYFTSKNYTYADAERAVAAFPFLSNIDEAKAYIGLKIVNGTEDLLAAKGIGGAMIDGGDPAFGGGDMGLYFKSNYSYTDAEKVMEAFQLPSVEAAKVYISDKIMLGNTHLLDEIGVTQDHFDEHEQVNAFLGSKTYTLADAEKALAAFSFLDNIQDAKGYIGLKIINGTEDILRDAGIGVRDPANVSVGPNLRSSGLDSRFTTKTTEEKGVEKGKGENGEPATLEWSRVKLQVTDKTTNKTFTIADNKKAVDEMKKDFKSEVYGYPEWSIGVSYEPVGGAGKYLSIATQGSGYSGGAHGWAGSDYSTFDATTGKQVSVGDLLDKKAADAALSAAVDKLKGAADAEVYLMGSSDKEIKDVISKSFAIFSDHGVARLAFAHPHAVEVARGSVLEAVIDAPKTKAFYEKVGLDHAAAASTALGDIVSGAPPAFPGSDIPYTAVSMDDVNGWLKDWFGPKSKMTKADKQAAADALYEAGAGAAMGVRMMMHQLAEELSPIEEE